MNAIFQSFGMAVAVIVFALATLIVLYISYILAVGVAIIGLAYFIYLFKKPHPGPDES